MYSCENLIGEKFGRLIVLSLLSERKNGFRIWECLCSCGNTTQVKTQKLKTGHTKSCGCIQREWATKNRHNYHAYLIKNKMRRSRWNGVGDLSGTYMDSLKQGAKHRNLVFEVSKEYLWDLFLKQNKKCALTGIELSISGWKKIKGNASVDRIDSFKGYVEGNIQWLHKDVNRMKMGMMQDDFISLCKLITENYGYKKYS